MSTTTQTPIEIAPKIMAIFNASTESFTKAEANSGEGFQGEWPPEGLRDVFLTGIKEGEGTMKFKDGSSVPCATIQFEYDYIRDETDPQFVAGQEDHVAWVGARFDLVSDSDQKKIADEGGQTRCRMNWERFKNHIARSLRKNPKDISGNVSSYYKQLRQEMSGDSLISLQVFCQYRPNTNAQGKTTIYKTEFVRARLA